MKKLLKKQKKELNLSDAGNIINAGAAAGITIAKFTKKKENIGPMIGGGLSLLVTGLILMGDE